MARYIDADELRRRVKEKTNPYGKPTLDYESGVKVLNMIDNAPTADVVPKSEFAKELIAEIAKGCTLKDYNNIDISIGYATAMNDVLWHLTKIKQIHGG